MIAKSKSPCQVKASKFKNQTSASEREFCPIINY